MASFVDGDGDVLGVEVGVVGVGIVEADTREEPSDSVGEEKARKWSGGFSAAMVRTSTFRLCVCANSSECTCEREGTDGRRDD